MAAPGPKAEQRGVAAIKDNTGREIGFYKNSYALLIGVSDYTAGWPDLESIPGELHAVENVLKKFGLWEKVSEGVRSHLLNPSPEKETPKEFSKESPLYYCMVVKTRELWEAAALRAKELGLTTVLLTTVLTGESREVGRTLAAIAKEINMSGNPVTPPCALIATGETAVRLNSIPGGQGGANQELAVGGCLDLDPKDPIVICALDTDGTDGPTPLAGALTDGSSMIRAREQGYDFYRALMQHGVSSVLKAVGDAVVTGPTGTNVNDLVVCVVL